MGGLAPGNAGVPSNAPARSVAAREPIMASLSPGRSLILASCAMLGPSVAQKRYRRRHRGPSDPFPADAPLSTGASY